MKKVFLLVDDDIDDVELFQEALSEIDSSAIFYHAPDGQEALDKLGDVNREKPNIVFLDINMPVMNGWQCLSKIKSIDSCKDIPVIIYSTASHQKEVDLAFKLGAICFFTKPRDFKELKMYLKVIADNLDGSLLDAMRNLKSIKCKISLALSESRE